jgi:hypothetical protein
MLYKYFKCQNYFISGSSFLSARRTSSVLLTPYWQSSLPTVLSTRPSFLDLSEDRNFAVREFTIYLLGSRIPETRCASQRLTSSSLSGLRSIASSLLVTLSTRGPNLRYPMRRGADNSRSRSLATSSPRGQMTPTSTPEAETPILRISLPRDFTSREVK